MSDLPGLRRELRGVLMRDPDGPRSKRKRRTRTVTVMGTFEQAVRVDELARSVPRTRTAVQRAMAAAATTVPLADRIRFAASLALLDTWSSDGRRLERPRGLPVGEVRHRDYPLSVQGPDYPLAQAAGFITRVVHVPETDDLVAVGWFPNDAQGRELTSRLAAGDLFLELDVDGYTDTGTTYHRWPPARVSDCGDPGSVGTSFSDWRVSRAVLGTNPCWDLPPAQVVLAVEGYRRG